LSDSPEKLVIVEAGAVAELDGCDIEGAGHEGFFAEGAGTLASLQGCTVKNSHGSNVYVRKEAHVVVQWCTVAGSKEWHGIDVHHAGTELVVEGCLMTNNKQNGVQAAYGTRKSDVVVTRCRSFGNGALGYHSCGGGEFTLLEVSNE
jgi:hypothetical protein